MVANALVRDDDEGDKEGQWQETGKLDIDRSTKLRHKMQCL